jgi:hypothetical protein
MEENKTFLEKFKKTLGDIGKTTSDTTAKTVENYYKPTPFKWRVIGDSILIIGTTVTAVAGLLSLSPYVVAAGAILTAVGKILTNFANK